MKYCIIIIFVIVAANASAQYWPSFEYKGPWITIRDLPETRQCRESWEVRGGVADSELTALQLSNIGDGRTDFGYFHFYGGKQIEASAWWADRLHWPPQQFNHDNWATYPYRNHFNSIGCTDVNYCFRDELNIATNVTFSVEGFGFCYRTQDHANSETLNSGYITTISYVNAWMRQPCPNTTRWTGDPDTTAYPLLPNIIPTNFLNGDEPIRMCDDYIHKTYGLNVTGLTEPRGGALIRIKEKEQDHCIYIFCDSPTHRLVLFSLSISKSGPVPRNVKTYGRQIPPQAWSSNIEPDSILELINTGHDSSGCFYRPVDIAVSSRGRYYDQNRDYIYVVDQGNHRIVKLKYDVVQDSLIWIESFAADILKMPTAIAYADYGDSSYEDDDVYVTDAGLSQLIRFSVAGQMEAKYGAWGSSPSRFGYPTGVAVAYDSSNSCHIYVSDSGNRQIVRYISETSGRIMAEDWYVFPMWPWPLISGVDVDAKGNVYVLNGFAHNITILDPLLGKVIGVFGTRGYEPGQFDYPSDIYIDGNEMQICELFADSSGIQSFFILPDSLLK
jgi:hypothetical protein